MYNINKSSTAVLYWIYVFPQQRWFSSSVIKSDWNIFSLVAKKNEGLMKTPTCYIKHNYIKCLLLNLFFFLHVFYAWRCLFYDVQRTHGVCHYTRKHNQTFLHGSTLSMSITYCKYSEGKKYQIAYKITQDDWWDRTEI